MPEPIERLSDLMLDHNPLRANLMGLRDDGALTDHGEAAEQLFLQRYRAIGAEAADDALVRHLVEVQCDAIESKSVEFGVSASVRAPVGELLYFLPQLRSWQAVPGFLATLAERHRVGIAHGRTPVRHLVEQLIDLLDRHIAERNELRPALETYRDVLRSEVLEHGRDTGHAGLCWLAGGETLYRNAIRTHTTLDLDPHELHETGLRLVEDLDREFSEYPGAVERIRADPALRYSSADEMIETATAALARAQAVAPQWFHTVPEQRCVIEPIAGSSPAGTPAHYVPPALDGSRPGKYFVPTRDPHTQLAIVGEATAFHETVPGHHLENARIALTDLPLLRRKAMIGAFSEGWALYCERLADEMGLYSTEEARLGMLVMDAKRAGRLVADTGLHAKGWSRQQAIDYLVGKTPMPRELAENEVDRYLSEPGQALAYMVGRLKFDELRRKADAAGADVRDFHEVVLSQGRLTLPLLDELVTGWLAER